MNELRRKTRQGNVEISDWYHRNSPETNLTTIDTIEHKIIKHNREIPDGILRSHILVNK